MTRLGTAALLVLSLAAGGCGGGGSATTTTNPSITVGQTGTPGYVPVGATGVSVSVPAGAIPSSTTLSVIPLTSAPQVGSPFPGSDSFITGLLLGTSISPLIQPVGVQVPVVQAMPAGTAVAGFELGRGGRSPIAASLEGGFIRFSTDHPGTYVFVARPR